ncbi:uncharacterized protein EV422DRAFT_527187 [Fimicolochytrium jonesii]|uniref:uncharacterized protein n=1 Tax=Fimicolochytrium jonesii TaxID=1396493 RepID=UPI0022FE551B|nr:uncharacterized protein EV422DRAFT_527187 [Fimicolochytrium jonesii]KAI8821834.1 hypothetical protein EV422DRAFT_527187 [Fimicolochytrium jonesii]
MSTLFNVALLLFIINAFTALFFFFDKERSLKQGCGCDVVKMAADRLPGFFSLCFFRRSVPAVMVTRFSVTSRSPLSEAYWWVPANL